MLSDPQKRRHYDQFGSSGQDQDGRGPFDFDTFFSHTSGKNGFFDFNFDDMFNDDIFGFNFDHNGDDGKLIQP